jgi:3-deoxy-7-phosphoheptulonate synthase
LIILLHPDADSDQRDAVRAALERLGVATDEVSFGTRHALVARDDDAGGLPSGSIARIAGVESVVATAPSAPLVHATVQSGGRPVSLGEAIFGGGHVGVIAGPCTVEDPGALAATARHVQAAGAVALRGGVFKTRTSPHSYQGGGESALSDLSDVARAVGLPFFTELTDPRQVETLADRIDGIQIGSRNMQNYPLLTEAARTGKPILLKRHMASSVDEWLLAVEYVLNAGNENVILCERGVQTTNRHVRYMLDVGVVPYLKARIGLPVVVDPSHAAGDWRLVPALSRAAIAAGADGLIIEVHPSPETTRCDAMQALPPAGFVELMDQLRALTALDGRQMRGSAAVLSPAVGV